MNFKIEEFQEKYGDEVKLIAVSKYQSLDKMEAVYQAGVRDFGENKVQELKTKLNWHQDINWHFIGRLQTNKVKEVVAACYLLHSLDRFELMAAINKTAVKQKRIMPCLLQFNLAKEATKTGFMLDEVTEIMDELKKYPNIKILGIMCMGPHIEQEAEIRAVFMQAKNLFEDLKQYTSASFEMKYLSMGMSGDYQIAIDCGSNMVRVGSLIFK